MSQVLRVFCYPDYADELENLPECPYLLRRLREVNVRLEIVRWNGQVESLPENFPVVIQYSHLLDLARIQSEHEERSEIACGEHVAITQQIQRKQHELTATGRALQIFCEQWGHIIIYQDRVICDEEEPWEYKPADNIEDLWDALTPYLQEDT